MKKRPIDWDNLSTAMITGASAGLGKEFSKQLARKGINLVIVARRENRLKTIAEELMKEYGIKVDILAYDLSKDEDVEKLVDYIKKREDLDILINNAGFGIEGGSISEHVPENLKMMKVHMWAPVRLIQAQVPKLKEKNKGFIINLSSLASFLPATNAAMYSTTKTFLRMLSRCIDLELDGYEARIQALCPGFTHTEFHDKAELSGLKNNTPSILWMNADKVISTSLKSLNKNKVVVLPGFINKLSRALITNKLVGKKMVKILNKKK